MAEETMVVRSVVSGLNELDRLITDKLTANPDRKVFVWMTAELGSENHSWCPDCDASKPVVEQYLTDKRFRSVFDLVVCHVSRAELRSEDRVYFNHWVRVTNVPTILSWSEPERRCTENECLNPINLNLVFESILEPDAASSSD